MEPSNAATVPRASLCLLPNCSKKNPTPPAMRSSKRSPAICAAAQVTIRSCKPLTALPRVQAGCEPEKAKKVKNGQIQFLQPAEIEATGCDRPPGHARHWLHHDNRGSHPGLRCGCAPG